MIIDSPVVSGSLASSGPFTQVGNVVISGSLVVTGSITMSGSIASAYQADSASYASSASYSLSSSYALSGSYSVSASAAVSSSYAISASAAVSSSYATSASAAVQAVSASYALSSSYGFAATSASYAQSSSYALSSSYSTVSTTAATASYADSFIVKGNLTAQTLVVQTISSSLEYSSGSNVFGNSLSNTQQLTGSVGVTGSLSVNNSAVISTAQTSSMSVLSSSYAATASYWSGSIASASVSISSSYATSASAAVSAASATSASYALTASYLLGYVSPFPFTGSAIISGSLGITGSLSVYGTSATIRSAANYGGTIFSNGSFGYAKVGIGGEPTVAMVSNVQNNTQSLEGITIPTASSNLIFSSTYGYNTGNDYNIISVGKLGVKVNNTTQVFTIPTSGIVTVNQGLIVSGSTTLIGNQTISGSSTATLGYTGSLYGTASFATTASYALNAGAGAGFPFSGSAVITGSLQITNLTSSGTSYLVADSLGRITAQSASAALKSTQAFTSTAGQTTFAVSGGFVSGYVDVFVNGTKLSTVEFNDTSGANVVLATGSFSGDVVEVVKYMPAAGVSTNVLRQLTTFTATAGQTVFSASYTPGLLDIYYNGARLTNADYTAANGTSITLATASVAGDILDVMVYTYQAGAYSGIGGNGTANQIAYYNTSNSITGSSNLTYNNGIITATGSLYLNSPNVTMGQFVGNQNGYVEFSVRNTSNGVSASGDIAVYADNGTAIDKYIDMGINNSGMTSSYYYGGANFGNALDAYMYNVGGNLRIGTANATSTSQSLFLFANPLASPDVTITGSKMAVGSNYTTPQATLDVSGSGRISSGLTVTGSLNVSGSIVTPGTITAQTLVVQTITSSVDYVTGSTIWGSALSNTHAITGSLSVTGSTAIFAGSVGIGSTSAPTYSLDVTGVARVNGTILTNSFVGVTKSSGGTYIALSNGPISDATLYFTLSPTGSATKYASISSAAGSNTNIAIGDTGGNVGIGTISPGKPLEVYRSAADIAIRLNDSAHTWDWTHYTATNDMAFSKDGSEKMRVTSGGYVGMATTSPTTTLQIGNGSYSSNWPTQYFNTYNNGGTSTSSALQLAFNNPGSYNFAIGHYGQLFSIGIANAPSTGSTFASTPFFNMTQGGSIGIGTISPVGKFEIASNANTYANAPAITFTDTIGDANSNRWIIGNIATTYGTFNIASAPTPTSTTWTPRLSILSNGNVGIGSTTPNYLLSVNNASDIWHAAFGDTSSTGKMVRIGGYGGTGTYGVIGAYSTNANTSPLPLILQRDGGNLLVGTTGDQGPLTGSVILSTGNVGAVSGYKAVFYNNQYGTSVGTPHFVANWASSGNWGIGADTQTNDNTLRIGVVTLTSGVGAAWNGTYSNLKGGAYTNASDYRIKENVVNVSDGALDKITSLRPVYYNIIPTTDKDGITNIVKTEVGFIAHEIQQYVPEVVYGEKDAVNPDGTEHHQAVDYAKLTAVIVKALQEANDKITALEEKLQRNNIN